MRARVAIFVLVCVGVASACRSAGIPIDAVGRRSVPAIDVALVESPAGPGSLTPNLCASTDEKIYLSWIERDGRGHQLRFSVRVGGRWTEPTTIARGDDWFVNWADFQSMIALPDGTLAAHWLARSGSATFAYDVHLSFSADGGRTWSETMVPHRDGTETEHGFVSMLPAGDGRARAVWLDGRECSSGHGSAGEMTLRTAVVDASGEITDELRLDGRVCECCQTSAAVTTAGAGSNCRGDGVLIRTVRAAAGIYWVTRCLICTRGRGFLSLRLARLCFF